MLKTALTHKSYLNEHPDEQIESNESLVEVGTSALHYALTLYLYEKDTPKDAYNKIRRKVMNSETLADVVLRLDIDEDIYVGSNEAKNELILANAFKSIAGAISLNDKNAIHDICRRILKDEITIAYKKSISSRQ